MRRILICGALALVTLMGCAKTSSDKPTVKVDVPKLEITEPKMPAPDKGGQPSNVLLSGKVVNGGTLDSRFRIEIVGGKGPQGKAEPVSSTKLLPLENITYDAAQALNNVRGLDYVALGCEQDPELIAKYTAGKKPLAVELQSIVLDTGLVTADTVIVCGPVLKRTMGLQITANTVVLKNVESLGTATTEKMVIEARNLVLIGKNKWVSRGQFVALAAMPGPDIKVEVLDQISGTGTLRIRTEGANLK